MNGAERTKMYLPMFIGTVILWFMNTYWYSYSYLEQLGAVSKYIDQFCVYFVRAGFYSSSYKLRLLVLAAAFLTCISKSGKAVKLSWPVVGIIAGLGSALYLFPFFGAETYLFLSTVGFIVMMVGFSLFGRKMRFIDKPSDDVSFDQCRDIIESDLSINLETRFNWQGREHRGYVNIISPPMGTLILGNPGVGKTYVLVWSIIEQAIRKGYTGLVYDFKMPDLTRIVYNEVLSHQDVYKKKYGKEVKFCLLNFDNPRQSMRCNPLNPRYISDMSDCHEIADLIMRNINPQSVEHEDFFLQSAKIWIAAQIRFLSKYNHGVYCSFPYLIELMGKDYRALLEIFQADPELKVMIQPFADALKGNAQEQLQGQIASARIPLLKFPSESLYWVLSGDDFSLNLNNPDEPTILCLASNPDRQSIYGTALSLYFSRIIKAVNHPTNAAGKKVAPSMLLFDEFPTVFINGIDNTLATARSNGVSIFLICQDITQMILRYGQKYADTIFNIVGNILSGRVNGETARRLGSTFGREFREHQSQTSGSEGGDTVSRSFQQQDILPQSKIETLSQGYFFGRTADEVKHPNDKKLFCSRIIIDSEERKRKAAAFKPLPDLGSKYFEDESIRERVKDNRGHECVSYLLRDLIEEDAQRAAASGTEKTEAFVLQLKAQNTYVNMTGKEKDALLEKVIEYRINAEMKKVMAKNYDKIKKDIDGILAAFGKAPDGTDVITNEHFGEPEDDKSY